MEGYIAALLDNTQCAKLTNEQSALSSNLINELKEKLRLYGKAMRGMAAQRMELSQSLVKQQEDQKDIFHYLKAELAKKTDEVRDLERRAAELDVLVEANFAEHNERMHQERDLSAHEQARLKNVIGNQRVSLEKVRYIDVCHSRAQVGNVLPINPSGSTLPRATGKH